MNKLLIFLFLSLSFSCSNKKKPDNNSIEIRVENENFKWLVGSWIRNNDKKGNRTYEIWSKKSDMEYIGLGFTLQDSDTISKERILLVKEEDVWKLKVKVASESEWTIFKMTSFTKSEFVCENPEHDFPKKIKYWSSSRRLNAMVSGDDFEIPFEFELLK